MKNQQVLKSFTALSFDGNRVTSTTVPAPSASGPQPTAQAGMPDAATRLDDVRDVLYQRLVVPYGLPAPHRYWGINE